MKKFNLQLFNDVPAEQAQVQQPATVTAAAEPTPAEQVQQDIEKIKKHIADLEADGKDLFSEEIANLKLKLDNAEAEYKTLTAKVETEVKDETGKVVDEIKFTEQSFTQKYGSDIANGLKIVLLAAIAGKIFGII